MVLNGNIQLSFKMPRNLEYCVLTVIFKRPAAILLLSVRLATEVGFWVRKPALD